MVILVLLVLVVVVWALRRRGQGQGGDRGQWALMITTVGVVVVQVEGAIACVASSAAAVDQGGGVETVVIGDGRPGRVVVGARGGESGSVVRVLVLVLVLGVGFPLEL